MYAQLHWPAGSATAAGPWTVALTPQLAGWTWTGLHVADLPAGGSVSLPTGSDEVLVLPLAGSCTVVCETAAGVEFSADLVGRADVFAGPTDFAYAPMDSVVTVSSDSGGRFAFPAARARKRLPPRRGAAEDAAIETRGAGSCSRLIRNYCMPDTFDADRLIVCEVVTPAGNWSSYPPHKHDEESETESCLEEIYYFEIADAPSGPGMAYQRVYDTSSDRPFDLLAEVHTGDVVLIPHGWHGPSIAVPGQDLYYLNVMAGPGERAWRICDDPAHAWIRATWPDQPVDPRVLALLLSSSARQQPGLSSPAGQHLGLSSPAGQQFDAGRSR
jgi:5-deoxy-glucuronate isomerase